MPYYSEELSQRVVVQWVGIPKCTLVVLPDSETDLEEEPRGSGTKKKFEEMFPSSDDDEDFLGLGVMSDDERWVSYFIIIYIIIIIITIIIIMRDV